MDESGDKISVNKTKSNKLTFEDLTSGETYKIKVRAKYNKKNVGAWSKMITINPQ